MSDAPQGPTRVLVLGTGALGSLYGGMLAQAGAEVTVVARSDYDAVAAEGVRVDSLWGDFVFRPQRVLRSSAEYGETPDYLLVCLKVLPEIDLVEMIRPVAKPPCTVVLMQNGIEIEPPIVRAFPELEVVSALAFVCCNRLAPGHVHHLDYGRLMLGRFPDGESEQAARLASLFGRVGVECGLTDNVRRTRWVKLVWNAPFNPMSVLANGATTAEILADPVTLSVAETVMWEVCRLAEADGQPLGETVVRRNLDDTRKMKPYRTSMLLDFQAGRPMEVEAILGNAVRAAERLKVEVPTIRCLYGLLRQVDRGVRQRAAA